MSCWIDVIYRVVIAIRITIKRLWIARRLDYRIRTNESSQFRVVVAGAVVVEACGLVEGLASEAVGGVASAFITRGGTEWGVF